MEDWYNKKTKCDISCEDPDPAGVAASFVPTKTNTIEWHKPEPTNITSIRKHSHFWYTLPRLLTPAPSLLLTCHCTSNNVPTDAQECGMHNDNSVHSWSLGALWQKMTTACPQPPHSHSPPRYYRSDFLASTRSIRNPNMNPGKFI